MRVKAAKKSTSEETPTVFVVDDDESIRELFSRRRRVRRLEYQTGRIAFEEFLDRSVGQRPGLLDRKLLDNGAWGPAARERPQGAVVIHIDPRAPTLSVFPFDVPEHIGKPFGGRVERGVCPPPAGDRVVLVPTGRASTVWPVNIS